MKKLFTIVCIALVFVSCKNETTEMAIKDEVMEIAPFDLAAVKEAIAKSNETYGEGFAKADSTVFISKYTSDACIMPANAPKLCGAEAIGMFFKGAQGMGVTNIKLTTEEVMGGPEVVVETGMYELFGADNVSLDTGKFIVAWKMEDGVWKMHRDMFTTNNPPAIAK